MINCPEASPAVGLPALRAENAERSANRREEGMAESNPPGGSMNPKLCIERPARSRCTSGGQAVNTWSVRSTVVPAGVFISGCDNEPMGQQACQSYWSAAPTLHKN